MGSKVREGSIPPHRAGARVAAGSARRGAGEKPQRRVWRPEQGGRPCRKHAAVQLLRPHKASEDEGGLGQPRPPPQLLPRHARVRGVDPAGGVLRLVAVGQHEQGLRDLLPRALHGRDHTITHYVVKGGPLHREAVVTTGA